MGKYYAVRKGKKVGIFNSWYECELQVRGYSGAEYKSFTNIESAKAYIDNKDEIYKKNTENSLIVFVDGSFSKDKNIAGYGCAFIWNEKLIHTISQRIDIKDENLWNVSAEISGALAAVEWAIENGYERLNIYYDYEGIQKWVDGSWEAKKGSTKSYKEKMNEYSKVIDIFFTKVKAHSGDYYNELVDELAKKAINQPEKRVNIQFDMEHNVDLTMFRMIVGETDHIPIQLKVGSFVFNDNVLNKIAKYFWKDEGNKIKELDSIEIDFDIRKLICLISYITIEKQNFHARVTFMEE
ncbi:viroplasmin family protein [Evansella clarkii]|uniref:ribonuclease H1 domain-containing protein n=1 Tax=Evansella clarkii TaxID=79879 RepID=UPI000996685B|nr:ribonuclease H family protein [Evansella clarkii]